MATLSYFDKLVAITEHYLGPASERFIRRQIEFHLNKDPQSINRSDITKLQNGVGVALSLLVNDKTIVQQALDEIDKIK